MIRFTRGLAKFVEKCPPPVRDTGCTYCELPDFPADKPINFDHNLNGTSAIPWKHILVFLHGITNFNTMPSKIELIPGSLANTFASIKRKLSPMHPVMVSNALVEGINVAASGRQKVYIYPDNKVVEFDTENLMEFVSHYLLPEKAVETYNPFTRKKKASLAHVDHSELFEELPMDENLVLICGHTQRDIRCGALAPLLQEEFERVLEHDATPEVKVGLISHIGGHAYAGNVIYFPKDCNKMPVVWYGRVFPELVQGIVTTTIRNGNIIKELYRGEV